MTLALMDIYLFRLVYKMVQKNLGTTPFKRASIKCNNLGLLQMQSLLLIIRATKQPKLINENKKNMFNEIKLIKIDYSFSVPKWWNTNRIKWTALHNNYVHYTFTYIHVKTIKTKKRNGNWKWKWNREKKENTIPSENIILHRNWDKCVMYYHHCYHNQ